MLRILAPEAFDKPLKERLKQGSITKVFGDYYVWFKQQDGTLASINVGCVEPAGDSVGSVSLHVSSEEVLIR